MEKHIASYNLASMEQNADRAGSSHLHVTPHDDGEPVSLNVTLKAPANYAYTLTYCGRNYTVPTAPRCSFTEQIERRHALEALEALPDGRVMFDHSIAKLRPLVALA